MRFETIACDRCAMVVGDAAATVVVKQLMDIDTGARFDTEIIKEYDLCRSCYRDFLDQYWTGNYCNDCER